MASVYRYDKGLVCFSHLSLQKYNLVLNWGVFSNV